MAIFARTLDQLVEEVCRQVDDWIEGQLTEDGTSATVKDTSLAAYDASYFPDRSSWIYIRGGTYAGHWAKISTFTVASGVGTITFSPVAGGVIVDDVTYSIHTTFKRADVVAKINLAIQRVAEKAHVWNIDTTSITLEAGTYEYDIPTSFMGIYRLTMADADGNFDTQPEIPPSEYWVIPGSTPKLHFRRTHADQLFSGHYIGDSWAETSLTADRAIRVEGLGSPAVLTTDASTCSISPVYITMQAAAWLHAMKIRSTENDPDDHRIQYGLCQDIAEREKAEVVGMQLPTGYKRCRE